MDAKVLLSHRTIDHLKPAPVHALVSLRPNAVAEDARRPIDVILAIDVSGSMDEAATGRPGGPAKIALARQAARSFTEQLRPGDRVGLVTYAEQVRVVCPLRELTDENRRELASAIGRLSANGGTDLAGGAIRAIQLMAELPDEADRTRRVILFTDGLPTAGITRHADVVRAVCSISGTKTPVTAMGFGDIVVTNGASGGGYDPELLTSLATQTGGNFYHTEGTDGILGAFAAELGALRSVAATDVRVEIVPGKDVAVAEVVNDLRTETRDGVTIVEVGNLYNDETGHVVVELKLPARDKTFPRDTLAATARVSGVEAASGPFVATLNAEFRYVKPDEADQKPDPAVEEQRVRLIAARAVEQAYAEASRGNFRAARATLGAVAAAAAAVGTGESGELSDVMSLMAADVGDPQRFAAKGRQVRASVMGIRTRRASGDEYTSNYATDAQRRAARDMRNAPTPTPPPSAPVAPPKSPGLMDRFLGRKPRPRST